LPSKQASKQADPGVSRLAAGQLYVTTIINAISSNPTLWNRTVIFLTWDDWGDYLDRVAPKQVDSLGYGLRVPLIVISPFVKAGNISYGNPQGVQEDFSAFPSTIEANWGLGNLTPRDGTYASLFYMFNFTQTPLKPLVLPTMFSRFSNCGCSEYCRKKKATRCTQNN
jgi:hypothetical protein